MHKRMSPHGDYDHMGETINLVKNFKVEKVIFNCGEYNDLEKKLIKVLDMKKIPYYFTHGSKTSSSKEFINEINPKHSIISVGKNNRYGHPNKGVLDNLKDSRIYRTDEDGSIMFKIKNNKLNIDTCSP